MPAVEPVIVELGIGTYPNAPFYARAAPERVDVVGVDADVDIDVDIDVDVDSLSGA